MQPGWQQRIMEEVITDRLHAKQGRSVARWSVPGNGRALTVYLKRHYQLPWWRGLLATVWPGRGWSPALEEWRHLQWAEQAGFSVPRALAAGESIGPWSRLQSFLAVEELQGMIPLNEAVPLAEKTLAPPVFRLWKQGLVREMARMVAALHRLRHFHRDLYLCHFFIAEKDTRGIPNWTGRVYLIDLHRLARHRLGWRIWQVKDLAQLIYSSDVTGVDARDRLLFWRYYRDLGRGSFLNRWIARIIVYKGRRYTRHNAKRVMQQPPPQPSMPLDRRKAS
jgi:heptose I phosphotransferase